MTAYHAEEWVEHCRRPSFILEREARSGTARVSLSMPVASSRR
jgi:hypothetical protein